MTHVIVFKKFVECSRTNHRKLKDNHFSLSSYSAPYTLSLTHFVLWFGVTRKLLPLFPWKTKPKSGFHITIHPLSIHLHPREYHSETSDLRLSAGKPPLILQQISYDLNSSEDSCDPANPSYSHLSFHSLNLDKDHGKRSCSSSLIAMTAIFILTIFLHLFATTTALGVNYGMATDNLPSPSVVANFIKTQTVFDSIKMFDTNPDVIKSFANTGISVTVTVGNGDIPALTNTVEARRWVAQHISPFYPQTKFKYVCVGSEILFSNVTDWINNLVPAMTSLHDALVKAGHQDVKVTTAHALNIFRRETLPSLTRFMYGYDQSFFAPILQFHQRTKSPFMINPYPYFSPTLAAKLNYALFKPNRGVYDKYTRKTYTNMFDALMDSTYTAMKALGYRDVDIAIGETGWPTQGDASSPFATMENSISYNEHVVKEILSSKGTPLMPNRTFDTYMFALFNENLKPGPAVEKYWGLFKPDLTPIYDVGLLRHGQAVTTPAPSNGKNYCAPKAGATYAQLQSNLDYVCSQGIDCTPIQPGGACYEPNDIRSHAAFAMNSYYRAKGQSLPSCDFAGTGQVISADPSYSNCRYL